MTRLLQIILTAAALIVSGIAQAAGPVSVSPSPVRINDGGATTVTLRWRVGVVASMPGIVTVRSPSGAFSVGGAGGGVLSQRVNHPGGGLKFFTINERLRIDRVTARRITQAGTSTYRRAFTDINGTSALTSVRLVTTSGGALSLRNLDLRFDDDTGYRTVETGAALSARLIVASNGRGLFRGTWEVAGPTATNGTGFRPISRERRMLAGARKTIIESPQLPTNQPGIYLVRFVPEGSRTATRTLRYSVVHADAGQGGLDSQQGFELISPAAGDPVTTATRFNWQPVAGAARYRLEFLAAGPGGVRGDLLAAVDVRRPGTSPRQTTLRRLAGHAEIYWRVVAYDSAGNTIAATPARRIDNGG